MRTLSLFCVFTIISLFSFASQFEFPKQSVDKEIETIIRPLEIKKITGFGGPSLSYTIINNENTFLLGGRGGVLINNFFFGGYGEGITNTFNVDRSNSPSNIKFGHGGGLIGYTFSGKTSIHPVISSRFGWGRLEGYSKTQLQNVESSIFLIVPAISAEIEVTNFFNINVGAEYRQVFNLNSPIKKINNDFSSLGVFICFLFGSF